MILRGDALPPAPWANIIANERAGCCISEAGSSCAWVDNSQYFRLTPWYNDPVTDPCGEAMYIRDEDSGEVWTATPAPIRHETDYIVTHGAGLQHVPARAQRDRGGASHRRGRARSGEDLARCA